MAPDNLTDEKRTRQEVIKLVNDVNKDLTFTSDVTPDFPDGKIPTLDIKVWLGDDQRVRYQFF